MASFHDSSSVSSSGQGGPKDRSLNADELADSGALDEPTLNAPTRRPATEGLDSETVGPQAVQLPDHFPGAASVRGQAEVTSGEYADKDSASAAWGRHANLGTGGGQYELIREIARGGMGVVYLARQPELDRLVALKMVLESDGASADELKRFDNEARAAAALQHPGIVPIYDVGDFDGRPFFSMAYVEGQSLAAMLGKGPLEPRRAAEIAKSVAEAIAHAHGQQIIHRDIKPANILIDLEGLPKLTDFGVCKSLASQSTLTSAGEVIGTPHYMPPEQAGTPDAVVGPASDVYSIGAVLYAMLTARPPFQAPSPIDVIAQVMTRDPVAPSKLVSGIPQDLETIALTCLRKESDERYASAQLLADDLGRFLNGEPVEAKPPGVWRRFRHGVRKHVFLASVSGSFAILLVALLVLLGLALLQSRAKVVQLRELLQVERAGVRRFVTGKRADAVSEAQYDVERLTDAAIEFEDDDRQLAIHLATYAGRLSVAHQVSPPDLLKELLTRIASEGTGSEELASSREASGAQASETFAKTVEAAESQIDRELTEFELAVFGLFDPAHKMDHLRPDFDGEGRRMKSGAAAERAGRSKSSDEDAAE